MWKIQRGIIAIDDTPYIIKLPADSGFKNDRIGLYFVSAARLPLYSVEKFRHMKMSGTKTEIGKLYNDLSESGNLAINFFLADNGKTRELKEMCTNKCLEFLDERRPIKESDIGVFCAYFNDICNGFGTYFSEYYVGKGDIKDGMGNEFVSQYQEVGKLARSVSKSILSEELEGRYVKDPHDIDLSGLDVVGPRLFMKIIRGSNKTSVPASGLLAEEKIIDAFKLARFCRKS